MSNNMRGPSTIPRQILRPHDVQLIHAHRRIKELEETLQAVRDDLEQRAEMGTYDGDHDIQLGNSVWHRLCKATDVAKGFG